LRGHSQPLLWVTLDGDGGRVATCGSPRPDQPLRTEVKVWDGAAGRPLAEWDEPNLVVARLALSPQGDRLALVGQQFTLEPDGGQRRVRNVLRVYDLDRREVVRSFAGESELFRNQRLSAGLAFSPDGTRLAAAGLGERAILVWDLAAEGPVVTHQGP